MFMRCSLRQIVLSSLFCACFAFVLQTQAMAEVRTWSDSSGSFSLRAEFVSLKDGMVTLKGEDGNEFEIGLDQLSALDQDFAKKQANKPVNPFQMKGSSAKKSTTSGDDDDKASSSTGRRAVVEGGYDYDTGNVIQGDFQRSKPVFGSGGIEDWDIEPVAKALVSASRSPQMRFPNMDIHHRISGKVVSKDGKFCVMSYHTPFGDHQVEGARGLTKIILFDLEKAKYQGMASQPGKWSVQDVDPGGQYIIACCQESGSSPLKGDVCLWRLGKDGLEDVVRFKPHPSQTFGLTAAAFIAEDQMMTLSSDEQLVFWSIPDVKPLGHVKCSRDSIPVLSNDGKYLYAPLEKTLAVIDTRTHEYVAGIPAESIEYSRLVLSPGGTRVAAVGRNRVQVWDATNGQSLIDQVMTTSTGADSGTGFVDEQFLMIGTSGTASKLFDTQNRLMAWDYTGTQHSIVGSALTWFVLRELSGGTTHRMIVGIDCPSSQIDSAIETAMRSDNYFAVKPGMKIRVEYSGISDGGERQKIENQIPQLLAQSNLEVSDQADVMLRLSVERGKLVKQRYRSFGESPFGGGTEYNFQPFICKATLQTGGTTLWSSSSGASAPHMLMRRGDETIDQALRRLEKPNYSFFSSLSIPNYVPYPGPNGAIQSLGKSTVTQYGLR